MTTGERGSPAGLAAASDGNRCGIRLNLHLRLTHHTVCIRGEISAIIYSRCAHGQTARSSEGLQPHQRLPTAHATHTCTIYAKNSARAAARCPAAEISGFQSAEIRTRPAIPAGTPPLPVFDACLTRRGNVSRRSKLETFLETVEDTCTGLHALENFLAALKSFEILLSCY